MRSRSFHYQLAYHTSTGDRWLNHGACCGRVGVLVLFAHADSAVLPHGFRITVGQSFG